MNIKISKLNNRLPYYLIYALFAVLFLLPVFEIGARLIFQTGIPDSYGYVRQAVLWIAMISGVIAVKEGKHLAIEAGIKYLPENIKIRAKMFSDIITIIVLTCYMFASVSFTFLAFEGDDKTGILSTRILSMILPAGFFFMLYYHVKDFIKKNNPLISIVLILVSLFFSVIPINNLLLDHFNIDIPFLNILVNTVFDISYFSIKPAIVILIFSGILGTPIFIVIGGITYLLLTVSGGYTEIAANEIYTVLSENMIPAIPLFTLTGFILSESKAGVRLINFFRSTFGWFPGGIFVATIVISAFFTTFTGASGVTILALGGILSVILENYGVDKKFSTGLLTSSGSIGLLFPPSLPIILYAIIAGTDIKEMFIGGVIPGFLLISSLSALGIYYTKRKKIKKIKIDIKEIGRSIKESIWELLLPLVVLYCYFSGLATLVETGSIAVLYVLIIEGFVHKEINLKRLYVITKKSAPVIGGILIILGVSKALSFYMIDEMIPQRLSEWIALKISSKIVFLILLNIVLLLTGCIMDIFSAIVVVVPLITPLGELYNIDPVHLGIIFLANLELGYLTPPVGLNLFLSSYRFKMKLEDVYMAVIPFFLIMLVTVILITFIPDLTLLFLK